MAKKILVIDDDPVILKYLKTLFEDNGYQTCTAGSSMEGLQLVRAEKPDLIVDYATLTGACVAALTTRYSGVFSNRPALYPLLEAAGRASGERVWGFPMDEDFDEELETPAADVAQCAVDGGGDHILASRFLGRFVGADTPWVHVDLAAGHRKGGLGLVPTAATGFGVRYTTRLLLDDDLLARSAAGGPE
jgi:leucyl aminopeptidase